MSYFYMTKNGTFTDSSSPINTTDTAYIHINELEYAITRLIVMGYSEQEINNAVIKVFDILKGA